MMLSGLWLLATGSAEAQQLSGLLVEDPPRRPLPDAVVQLLADRDSVAASVTSSVAGRFVLRALMAGRYRVQVLRIGHSPWVSGFLTLAVGEARDTTLAIPLQPVTLQDIAPDQNDVRVRSIDLLDKPIHQTVAGRLAEVEISSEGNFDLPNL